MQSYDGWEPLRDHDNPQREMVLGKGGQGEVYLVRSAQRAAKRSEADSRAKMLLLGIGHNTDTTFELAKHLMEVGGTDPDESLGALKKFAIPSPDSDEEAKDIG